MTAAILLPRSLPTDRCLLRAWLADEATQLAHSGDNPNIFRNLWDGFPTPYTLADARAWLTEHAGKPPLDGAYAIEVEGKPIGTIAVHPQKDVERLTGEVGYWLAQDYWGRGIATSAVTAVTEAVFRHTHLVRLHAPVFSWNPASMRVLEKARYVREAVLQKSIVKEGILLDRVLFARTRPSSLPYQPYRARDGRFSG